ncbi:glycosyltransferase family 4 protein [Mucisphaera calidilacus]|uniref:WecA-like glycosyltransferase n=1 Tax=Mucisphaera calidilacus TaxID=2527982 RepID=A0A518BY81_9BACT|nr:MraY family glycosyltransferase [Mucisphaera calidilacus]QDU71937.1 WecA-like glycosyltransferase [Mucisphaera calidilacus]
MDALTTIGIALASGLVVSGVAGEVVLRVARRWSLNDRADEAHKSASARVPNVGGIGIVAGWLAALAVVVVAGGAAWLPAWLVWVVGGALVLHVMGLVDDRVGLGAWLKLGVQLLVAAVVVVGADVRVLTLMDAMVPGGYVLSCGLTVLWLVVICNAVNFLDNMDGLASGVSGVAGAVFLAASLMTGQVDVGVVSACLVGAALGFLVHNAPPARMYMGDGGSLVLGFVLGVVSVALTYVGEGEGGTIWYGVLTPVIVLAVPVYDFVSVVVLRLRAGRSPMSADRNHLSHRLERIGLSRPMAVSLIALLTLATGLGGVTLSLLTGWQALLVAVQTLAILGLIAMVETLGSSEAGSE